MQAVTGRAGLQGLGKLDTARERFSCACSRSCLKQAGPTFQPVTGQGTHPSLPNANPLCTCSAGLQHLGIPGELSASFPQPEDTQEERNATGLPRSPRAHGLPLHSLFPDKGKPTSLDFQLRCNANSFGSLPTLMVRAVATFSLSAASPPKCGSSKGLEATPFTHLHGPSASNIVGPDSLLLTQLPAGL